MTKFLAEPNLLVFNSKTKKPWFSFDQNGEFETSDEKIIIRLKANGYRFEDVEEDLQDPPKGGKKK